MDKTILKQVREYLNKRYEDIVKYLNYENDIDHHIEDIMLLLEHEPYFIDEIASIKQQLELDKQEAQYQELINDKVSPQQHMLEYLKEALTLNEEELNRCQNIKAKTKSQIRKKQKRIEMASTRIEELQKSIEKITELIKDIQPEKRKVGRPKKNKENVVSEEEKQEES